MVRYRSRKRTVPSDYKQEHLGIHKEKEWGFRLSPKESLRWAYPQLSPCTVRIVPCLLALSHQWWWTMVSQQLSLLNHYLAVLAQVLVYPLLKSTSQAFNASLSQLWTPTSQCRLPSSHQIITTVFPSHSWTSRERLSISHSPTSQVKPQRHISINLCLLLTSTSLWSPHIKTTSKKETPFFGMRTL